MLTKETVQELFNEISVGMNIEGVDAVASAFNTFCEQRGLYSVERKPGSGRKDGFTKKLVVTVLRAALETGVANAQRHYLERLVEAGYLEKVNIPTDKRGRPPVEYRLTTRGRSYANLSKNWKI